MIVVLYDIVSLESPEDFSAAKNCLQMLRRCFRLVYMAIKVTPIYPPTACELMYGKPGSDLSPRASANKSCSFQNQKKSQQEKLRSNGIRNPRPITKGYIAKGKLPIALNGGLESAMLYLLLNTCGMVGNRK